jgi:hypothetical protein
MSRPAGRRFWAGLGAITAVALAWRAGYVIWQIGRLTLNGDAFYYHTQANHIAEGLWFVDPGQYVFFGRETPSAGHPPAYLLYLAGVSRAIGTSETTHRLASTLLGAGAVLVIGVIARRIFGSDRAGWAAAAIAAVYAHLWINDEMLMSESMYVLTTALAVLAAYAFWGSPTMRRMLVLGAAIGLAALSRAEAATLVPLLVVPFALLRRELAVRRRVELAIGGAVAAGLMLAPWVLFNLTRFEHPVAMSNGIGSVLMVANCDYVDPATGEELSTYRGTYAGYWHIGCSSDLEAKLDRFYTPARAAELKKELGILPGTDFAWYGDESTHEVAWRAVGVAEIRDRLGEVPRVVVLRILRMWDLFRPSQNIDFNAGLEGRGAWQSSLASYQYFVLVPPALAGLVVLRRRRVPVLPFVALAATITVTAAMTFGITRYRAPVDAMLPVLAGGAIATVWHRAFPGSRDPASRS